MVPCWRAVWSGPFPCDESLTEDGAYWGDHSRLGVRTAGGALRCVGASECLRDRLGLSAVYPITIALLSHKFG